MTSLRVLFLTARYVECAGLLIGWNGLLSDDASLFKYVSIWSLQVPPTAYIYYDAMLDASLPLYNWLSAVVSYKVLYSQLRSHFHKS